MRYTLRRIILQTIAIVCLGTLLGFSVNYSLDDPLSLQYEAKETSEKYPVVDYETAKEYADTGTAIFIDAREPAEYKAGHIQGSINIPAYQFGEYFEKVGQALPKEDVPIIVYCQGDPCDQSHIVLEHLSTMGYQNLHIYLGGWNEWKQHQS